MGNALVIQGARDAADTIHDITSQVSTLTVDAMDTVTDIELGLETSKSGLLNFSGTVVGMLEDLKSEAATAKATITSKVQARLDQSVVIEFSAVANKIDATVVASAAKAGAVLDSLKILGENSSSVGTL